MNLRLIFLFIDKFSQRYSKKYFITTVEFLCFFLAEGLISTALGYDSGGFAFLAVQRTIVLKSRLFLSETA